MTTKALDALGVAITNAGYTWTPEMRSAYEKGIRESEWVGLTNEEIETFKRSCHLGEVGYDTFIKRFAIGIEAKLKEKNT